MNTSSPNQVNQPNSLISVDNNRISARGKSVLKSGEVALVGSGPGDAELLTIRAMRFIEQAEIAIYDRLVSDEILALLPENCERFYVGKEHCHSIVDWHC